MLRWLALLGALVFAGPVPTEACQFDSDCAVGSRCERGSGSLYGWCLGGMNPGNTHDRQPGVDRNRSEREAGQHLSFRHRVRPASTASAGRG